MAIGRYLLGASGAARRRGRWEAVGRLSVVGHRALATELPGVRD
ncbi:MAG TPA: hypothetical protein VF108_09685 [Actinomycetota bacterium]